MYRHETRVKFESAGFQWAGAIFLIQEQLKILPTWYLCETQYLRFKYWGAILRDHQTIPRTNSRLGSSAGGDSSAQSSCSGLCQIPPCGSKTLYQQKYYRLYVMYGSGLLEMWLCTVSWKLYVCLFVCCVSYIGSAVTWLLAFPINNLSTHHH